MKKVEAYQSDDGGIHDNWEQAAACDLVNAFSEADGSWPQIGLGLARLLVEKRKKVIEILQSDEKPFQHQY